jgi:kynurenine formamidase
MMRQALIVLLVLLLSGCGQRHEHADSAVPTPREIIDLGTLITTGTPKQFWGTKLLQDLKFTEPNSFNVIHWKFGPVSGSNGYYTLFNHGGPHIDAPNHVGVGHGLDSYSIDSFAGPLKVLDFSHSAIGRSITVDMVANRQIVAGDIVLIYTGYKAPINEIDWPENAALTYEAAEYLANIPVRAIGTDAFNVDSLTDQSPVAADNEIAEAVPGHHVFLTRGIPVYEQLVNVESLLGKENMYFVGVPINIKDGDGMIIRPVVLVY